MLVKLGNKQLRNIINNRHDQQMKYCLQLQNLLWQRRNGATRRSLITVFGVMSMMLLVLPLCGVDAGGYSYTRFIGPVAGPEHKIFINDASSSGGSDVKKQHRGSDPIRLDYVAKPEYDFAYGVEDADTHVLHNRNEMRDGDAVKGVYSLIDPDGTLRVVKYTADEINGFRAEVVRNRVPILQGQIQHDNVVHGPPTKTIIYNLDDYHNPKKDEQQKQQLQQLQQHYPQTSQIYLKGDKIAYNPSSSARKPNLEKFAQNNYETPSQPDIIYHYNKNYGGHNDETDESDNVNGSNESDNNHRPHYEVHERPDDDRNHDHNHDHDDDDDGCNDNQDQAPQYKVHEKPDEYLYDEDGNVYKSKISVKADAYNKKKPHHRHDDDDDDDDDDDGDADADGDDDDYYGVNDSDELDDFDDAVSPAHNSNSEESNEYY